MRISHTRSALALAGVLLATAPACFASTYFMSPSGDDTASGSIEAPWQSIARAQQTLRAGDRLYIRGGKYVITAGQNTCASVTDTVNAINLKVSGTASNPIQYFAYTGETPVFDFSQMKDNCRIKGFNVVADWIYMKGLEITGVPQNNSANHESWGVWIKGSHNVFEQLNIHHIMGAGLLLQDGAYNLILNTDSHHNYDPLTSNGAGQSGDGFGAHISAGNPGNVFRGCRAWWNSDDGFDLINAYSPVTIENSWAWLQGYLPGTTTAVAAGNGNGFKAGGYGGGYVANAAKHIVRQSVAFLNKSSGFYANHHPVANDFFNNTSYKNHPDFNMLGVDASGAAVNLGNLRNNIAYLVTSGNLPLLNITGTNSKYNTWDLGLTVKDADFTSLATTGWDAARQADGSLPVVSSLHLAAGSQLINKGSDVGLSYLGTAPDLGAFEKQ